MEEQSNNLAIYLLSNLNEKTPIAVYGHKNPYMIVCFLACVKSGRAYCPIDISVPQSRIEAILDEVRPEIVLITEKSSVNYENILSLQTIISIAKGEAYLHIKYKKITFQQMISFILYLHQEVQEYQKEYKLQEIVLIIL